MIVQNKPTVRAESAAISSNAPVMVRSGTFHSALNMMAQSISDNAQIVVPPSAPDDTPIVVSPRPSDNAPHMVPSPELDNASAAVPPGFSDIAPVVVPTALFEKRTTLFCLRIALALAIMTGAAACMLSGSPWLFMLGLIVQGAMYVHLIEFQHSVLHLQVFESHRVTRVVGFLLGLPMMISFSDFQYKHLRHHKFLGTKLNTETFDYKRDQLNSILGFARATLDYSRLSTLVQRLSQSFSDERMLAVAQGEAPNTLMEARVREEYQIFGFILLGVTVYCITTHDYWPLILWMAPYLASEPVHFLLELPEHIGLPAHSNENVFENTRTWGGSWFARWFSHYTNFHIAHHFNQLIPMDNLPQVQKLLDRHIPETSRSKSYPHFYLQVIRGEIKP